MASSEEHQAKSRIGKVDLSKLKVDITYQRTPSPSMVDQIEENWDIVSSELLLVADRGDRPEGGEVEGGLFLINGQHRSLAARRKGIKSLEARILDLSDEEDPAAIEAHYRLDTGVGLSDKATEKFKARIRAGDEESI